MSSKAPKVAILGFHLESNAFCPPSVEADFLAQCWEEGDAISELVRGPSRLPSEVAGFYDRMNQLGDWTPAPLIVIGAPPGGPAGASVWATFLAEVERRLRAALPVDAVYVANHGASSAVGENDTEGVLMRLLREIVGPDVPLVATHDLHCNVSAETVAALDGLIAYRTNPHVDQRERAAEAADMIHEILGGTRMVTAYVRLPLTPPSVTLSTASGPYADLVALGASLTQKPEEGPIANVAVCAGFVFSDLPKCGVTITVTARGDLQAARRKDAGGARGLGRSRPLCGQHRRGGARGRTGARRVGRCCSPTWPTIRAAAGGATPPGCSRPSTRRASRAWCWACSSTRSWWSRRRRWAWARNSRRCSAGSETEYSRRYAARARVLKLTDGEGMGRRGILKGRKFSMGDTCLLELVDSGMKIVAGSLRRQLAEPAMLEMHGIDIARARHVIKSRGPLPGGLRRVLPEQAHRRRQPGPHHAEPQADLVQGPAPARLAAGRRGGLARARLGGRTARLAPRPRPPLPAWQAASGPASQAGSA